MKKLYLLLVLTILSLVAYGQTSKTINVETAGTLPSLISDEEKYTIEELTLTGNLNGTDFRLLRDMAGNNYLGEPTEGRLTVLDLSGASIVAGGEKYLDVDMINNSDLMKGSGPCHLSIETNNTLPNYCFASCKLERLILPDNLTTIDFNGLSYLTKMTYIHLPKSLISIVRGRWSINPFVDCVNLQEIDVDPLNEVYTSIDGVLFSKDGKTLMSYPASKSCDSYDIPSSVTTLFGEAFYYSKNVLSMSIPNGVSGIPDRTFSNSSVSSITIPSSIKSIGNYSFGGCNLGSITFSEGLESIGDGAFGGNKQLESVSIPSTVTQIGANPFRSCEKLQRVEVKDGNSVYDSRNNCNAVVESASNKLVIGCSSTTIPNDILIIGSESFYGNKDLTSITIPSSVSVIESYAFNECRNLTTVILPNTITSIGRSAFSFTNLTSVKIPEKITVINENTFFSCTKLVEVFFPENLSEIRSEAFSSCWNLNSVKIPSSVTAIGEKAFYACKGLSVVMSDIEEPFMISDDVFALSNGFSTATLCVPVGCASKYQATDGWKLFTKIVEPIDETYDSDLETPLTFEAIEGKVTVRIYNKWIAGSIIAEYSVDGGPWTEFYVPDDYAIPEKWKGKTTIPAGHIVRLRSNKWYGGGADYMSIRCDADCYVYGNVMSLVKGENFATDYTSLEYCLGRLFYNNKNIKNHPEKEIVLPATTLRPSSYFEMFSGCTGLTKAPELPAETLSDYCYKGMFNGCSNLNEVVCKATDISATDATTDWLNGVAATGTFMKPSIMTSWTTGVNGIPTGWTVNDFNTKVEKDDVVYTPNDEDHTVTVSDGGESSSEIVIQSSISINGQSYEVTAIGDCAFQNNELLVKVTIPETIASIGSKAFAGCTNLKSIYIYVKVPINLSGGSASRTRGDGGSSVFSGVDTETCVLYVPAGSGEAYRSADVWKEFKNIVEIPVSASIKVAKGMTTYTGEYNLDFSGFGDEVKAYVATGYDYDNNVIWLTRVKDVPAGTPILVKAPASETPYDVPVKESSGCYYKNMLVGNLSGGSITLSKTTGEMTNYYLSDGIFCTSTGSNTISHGKCYLQIPTTPPASAVGSSQSVTLNANGFASFCGSQDLDFSDVEGLKAYAVTGYDDASGTIWLTRVKRVSAKTALLLKGESKGSYTIPSVAVGSYYANMLVGNLSGETITIHTTSDGMTNYYLSGNQLKKATDGGNPIGNGKAYMQIPSKHVTRSMEDMIADLLLYGLSDDDPEVISMPVVGARGLNGDGTTNIREKLTPEQTNDIYYNLQGQRVDKPTKGLYIKNGRKVVIK